MKGMRSAYFTSLLRDLNKKRMIACEMEEHIRTPVEAPVYRENREPSPPPRGTDNSGEFAPDGDQIMEPIPPTEVRRSTRIQNRRNAH